MGSTSYLLPLVNTVSSDGEEPTLTNTATMLLVRRRRVKAMPAIVDKHGLVTMYGRATTTQTARVPRLSQLMRIERHHRTSLSRARRRFAVASALLVLVVFALGVAAGTAAKSPELRSAVTAYIAR